MRVRLFLTLGIAGLVSCTTVTRPPADDAANNFRIVLDQPQFTPSEASQYGIKATVTNTSSDQDFYSNVGDGFNSAPEQATIFAVMGTHAVIERRVSGVWQDASAGALIEGSRFVVLIAGRSYHLVGSIAPRSPGTYRIRLDYFTRIGDPSATPLHDYSAAFRVQ